MAAMKLNSTVGLILRVLISIGLLGFIVFRVQWADVLKGLAGFNLVWFVVLLLVRSVFLFIRGIRMWVLLEYGSRRILPMLKIVGWNFVALNAGTITPAQLGDFSIARFVSVYGVKASTAIMAVLIDKIFSLAMVSLLAAGCVLVFVYRLPVVLVWATVAAALCLAVLLFTRKAREPRTDQAVLDDKALLSLSSLLKKGATIIKSGRLDRGTAAKLVVLAFLQSVCAPLQLWAALKMTGVDASPHLLFWLHAVPRLLNQLPISINGIGVYEISTLSLLATWMRLPYEASVSAVIFLRVLTWLTAGVVLGWLSFSWRGTLDSGQNAHRQTIFRG